MRRGLSIVAAMGAIGALAACSPQGVGGSASPTPSSGDSSSAPTSSTAALPFAGAPKVSNPLPASVIAGDPCTDALTPDQVKQAIGVEVAGKSNTAVAKSLGPSCVWANPTSLGQVVVTYVTQVHTGLSAEYQNTKPKNPVWRPLPDIQGLPAVAFSNNTDQDCTVAVGLADDLSINVGVFLGDSKRGKADSCEVTASISQLVVDTLKKRAGS